MLRWVAVRWHLTRLRSSDCDVVQASAIALGRLGDLRAVQPLIQVLTSKEPRTNDAYGSTRDAVARALGELGSHSAVQPLIEELSREPSEAVIWALGQLGNPIAIGGVKTVVFSYRPRLRYAAANALESLGDSRWKKWIEKPRDYFKSDEEQDKANIPDFARLASSEDIEVGKLLVDALVQMKEERRDVFGRPKDALSAEVVQAIVDKLVSWLSFNVFLQLLRSRSSNVRTWAIWGLPRLPDERVSVLLWEIFEKHKTVDARTTALEVMAECPAKLNVDVRRLTVYLADPCVEIRQGVVSLLGHTADQRAVPVLKKCLIDVLNVREAAAKSLKMLGEPQWIDLVERRNLTELFRVLWATQSEPLRDGIRNAAEQLCTLHEVNEEEVNRDAAFVFGETGEPSAIRPLIALSRCRWPNSDRTRRADAVKLIETVIERAGRCLPEDDLKEIADIDNIVEQHSGYADFCEGHRTPIDCSRMRALATAELRRRGR